MRRLATLVLLTLLVAAACSSSEQKPGPNDGSTLDFERIWATIVIDDVGIHILIDRPPLRANQAIKVVNRGTKDHGLTSDTIETGTLRPNEETIVFLTAAGTVELKDRTDLSHTLRIDVSEAASS
jgi:hypothetical protein